MGGSVLYDEIVADECPDLTAVPENLVVSSSLILCIDSGSTGVTVTQVRELAKRLGVRVVASAEGISPGEIGGGGGQAAEMVLAGRGGRLELYWFDQKRPRPICVELVGSGGWSRGDGDGSVGGRNGLLGRAIGLKKKDEGRLVVVDATAGLGEDSWRMAGMGCEVTALERSPIMAAMLADGLRRAGEVAPAVAGRIKVVEVDAIGWLSDVADRNEWRPDVVYLDPMYPTRRKAALGSRRLRALHRLVGDDADFGALFEVAVRAAGKRVVVKRPVHADPIGKNPTASHRGKMVRYDVYVPGV